MKQISLIGNLTKDCKLVDTSTPFIAFSMAVNEKIKGLDSTTFFDVASSNIKIKDYLTKGKKVFVQGNFKIVEWEHQGKKGTRLSISATLIELLGGKEESKPAPAPSETSITQTCETQPEDEDSLLPF